MLEPNNITEGSSSSSITNEVKYTGVRKRKWGMYVSEIRIPNSRERIWLGSYDTAEQAAKAFDAALFCLRGPNAKFNFPEDAPLIPDGQSLGPVDIQRVAQEYAFVGTIIQPPVTTNNGGGGDVYEVNPEPMENDWSFLNDWDMYGSPVGGNASEFGYPPDTGQMYLPLSTYASNEVDESGCIGVSFLWNF